MEIYWHLLSVTLGATGFTLIRKNKDISMIPAMGINGLFSTVVALVFIEAVILSFEAMIYIFAMGVMQALSFSLITSAGQVYPGN